MRKQGFTLVELLAVIVVLGIILLIAIPKISNVIDNSKEKAFQVSSFGIVKAANYYCETKRLTDLTYPGGTFTALNGKLLNGGEELPVSDIALEGDSFVNIDENCNVQMSVTDGLYYATKEYDEVGVAVTLSENAALTRDQMTQQIEALQADVVSLSSQITTLTNEKVSSDTLNTQIASLTDKTNINNVFLKTYPLGSIYMSKESANPSTLFGGTWVAWGSGRVPVGVNSSDTSFDTVEETGGEKTHLNTYQESGVPAHEHLIPIISGAGQGVWGPSSASNPVNNWIATNSSTPANAASAHNNLQPYITVYMWKRTA